MNETDYFTVVLHFKTAAGAHSSLPTHPTNRATTTDAVVWANVPNEQEERGLFSSVDLYTFDVGLIRNKQQFLMMTKIPFKWHKKLRTRLKQNWKHLIGSLLILSFSVEFADSVEKTLFH